MRHVSVGHDEPLRNELISFVDAVRNGTAPAVTGEEGVASLEIATRCLESRPIQAAAPQHKGPRRAAG
jgi:predicted dehydrogenase